MNEVDTPAVSTAAETPVETPVATPVETAETTTVSTEADTPSVQENTPVATPTDNGASRLETLLETLGDIPDEPNAKLLENIDERSLQNLPDSMKGLFKHLVAAGRQRLRGLEDQVSARNKELDAKYEELKEQNRIVIRNRAQLNQVLLDRDW